MLRSTSPPLQRFAARPPLWRRATTSLGLLLIPIAVLFLAIYLYPIGLIFSLSLNSPEGLTAHYVRIVSDPFILDVLWGTVRLAAEVTALCLILGYPVAYLMRMSGERVRHIVALLVLLPLWTSILVRSYAWVAILGRNGLVNRVLLETGITDAPIQLLYNRFGVYVGMVHIMLPFLILPLFSTMQRIDTRFVAAASSLGASPSASFLLVFFPLSLPGVLAGSLLVFMISLGFFVTPALLGGLGDVTYVMLIEKQINELNNWGLAAAMAVVLLVTTLLLVLAYQRLLSTDVRRTKPPGAIERQLYRAAARLGHLFTSWQKKLQTRADRPRRSRLRLSRIAGWTVVALIICPITVLLPLAFSGAPFLEFPPSSFSLRWFENYFGRSDWTEPTLRSVYVALITTAAATTLGSLAAIALVRGEFRGKSVALGLFLSPMIVPSMILAIALYFLYARYRLVGTVLGLTLAHTVLATPYVIVVVSAALRTVDTSLERAAQTLGAGPTRAFVRVTLPLIRPAVLTAALFAFLTSFDELVVALFVSGTRAATLPKRMWEGIRFEIDPTTAAVSVILLAVSVALMGIAEVLRSRARAGAPALGGSSW